MFSKVAVLVVWLAAVSASDPGYGGPLLIPQVGISKGIRSQSPEIIYLSSLIDDHNVHSETNKQLDPNDVIASVYGPAFLQPEWIWSGDRQIRYDPDRDSNYGRNRHHEPERMHEIQSQSEHQRLLQLKRLREEEQMLEIRRHREQERILELKRLQEQERLNEIRRLKEKESLIELHRHQEQEQFNTLQKQREYQQWKNLERQRAHEQMNVFLKLREQGHVKEIRQQIPSLELERLRELERQRELIRPSQLTYVPEIGGDQHYPGYDYPIIASRSIEALRHNTGLRYADAGYAGRDERTQEPHGWGKGYRPAWARLPEVAFHSRHHDEESNKYNH